VDDRFQTAAIQNTRPRIDVDGNVIDCHDGCLRRFGGRFYWFGTRYGHTDGFTPANVYTCYSSSDLMSWHQHGSLLINPPPGVFYRPYVAFNPNTAKYVLWFNWYPKLWEGHLGVALADQPEGPYDIVNPNVRLAGATPGDHNLFVDDDGTGYVIYTNIAGDGIDRHAMTVEKLSPDFTASTLERSETLDRKGEAPAMFKRGGLCYVLFGNTCCFCPHGADVRVFAAEKPLGPYRQLGEINRDDAGTIIVPAQQTDVFQLQTPDGPVHLWLADLWGSRIDGIKGHDLQYWSSPLRFESDGSIRRLVFDKEHSLRLF